MRVKRGYKRRRRRNRLLKLAKGYFGARHNLYATAKQAVHRAEKKRDELIARIRDGGDDLEFLRLELAEAREREELHAREWIVEREADELPHQDTVMPWARSSSEDRRYRWSLVLTIVAASAVVLITLRLLIRFFFSMTRFLCVLKMLSISSFELLFDDIFSIYPSRSDQARR